MNSKSFPFSLDSSKNRYSSMLLASCSARTAKWVRAETVKAPVMNISLKFSGGVNYLNFSTSTPSSHIKPESYCFGGDKKKKPSKIRYTKAENPLARHIVEKSKKGDFKNTDDMCTYMTSIVLSSYRSQLINLELDLRNIDMSKTLDKIKVSTCQNLKLWGVSSVTQNKLLHLLDTIKVTGTLTFLSSPGTDFYYQKPFRMQHLNVKYAKWFTRANLLMSNCETISLNHSRLECKDLHTFVRQWKQGQYKKLKKVQIRQENEIHMECVTKGLEAKSVEKDRIKEYDV